MIASWHTPPGTWPTTQACALTENWTSDPLFCRQVLSPLSHTSQGWFYTFLWYLLIIFLHFPPFVGLLKFSSLYLSVWKFDYSFTFLHMHKPKYKHRYKNTEFFHHPRKFAQSLLQSSSELLAPMQPLIFFLSLWVSFACSKILYE